MPLSLQSLQPGVAAQAPRTEVPPLPTTEEERILSDPELKAMRVRRVTTGIGAVDAQFHRDRGWTAVGNPQVICLELGNDGRFVPVSRL